MKIEILYLDKFKFEFEEKLFTIYLERLKKISKNQFSQINTLKISHKKLSERLLHNRKNEIIIITYDGLDAPAIAASLKKIGKARAVQKKLCQ